MRPSNEGSLVNGGQVKTWIRLDTQNWFGYQNLITIGRLPFLGDTRNWHPSMKHQRCRNVLHTVATRGKTSGVAIHVGPKRPTKQICLYNHTHSLYRLKYSTLLAELARAVAFTSWYFWQEPQLFLDQSLESLDEGIGDLGIFQGLLSSQGSSNL